MADDSLIGAIAPLVTASGDGGRVIAAGPPPRYWRMFTHMTVLSSLPPRAFGGHHEFLERVKDRENHLLPDWVSGGCVLVRRDALEVIGGLWERWFMYAEDIDMCLRLNDAGWHVVLVPALQATHETGQSSAGIDGRVSVVWLTSLFDLYATRYRARRIRQFAWAIVAYLGFRARQAHASYKVGQVRPGRATKQSALACTQPESGKSFATTVPPTTVARRMSNFRCRVARDQALGGSSSG